MVDIENDYGAELVCCPCGADGAVGNVDISEIYNALGAIYAGEELEPILDDEQLDGFRFLLDIVYLSYGGCINGIWVKRRFPNTDREKGTT
jgi:hypothetical protein